MGKSTGFIEISQKRGCKNASCERIKNWDEFTNSLSKEEQELQGARCMDCGVPFCHSECPVNNLIPEWNDLIYRGKWKLAVKRLLKTNNFPEFTGRVCPALCENSCTVSLNGDCVTIKDNEKSIIERAFQENLIKAEPPKVRSDKRIAVIGSGPAGLAAADSLNKRGHNVVVFERSDRIGGLLMYGIPNMKLDKKVIDRRVKIMEEEGIQFITNANVGENYSGDQILKEFDSVLIATGASKPREINVEGKDLLGINYAVDFLGRNTKSFLDSNLEDGEFISAKDKNVVVIGGGDTGTDCVGTSIRHGCKSVVQLEIMPKSPRTLKIDYGQEEAISVFKEDPRVYETTVKSFIGDSSNNVSQVVTVKVEWIKNENDQFIPREIPGTEKTLKADLVLLAIGFVGTEEYTAETFGLERNERQNIKTQNNTFNTTNPKIFVAGDARRGQSLVAWAIREGREAAIEVDKNL